LPVENCLSNFGGNIENFFVERMPERFFCEEKNESHQRKHYRRPAESFKSILDSVQKEVEVVFFRKFRLDEPVVQNMGGVRIVVESPQKAFRPPNPKLFTVLLDELDFGRTPTPNVFTEVFSVKNAENTQRKVAPPEGERLPLEHVRRRPLVKNAVQLSESGGRSVNNIVRPRHVHRIERVAKGSNRRYF